MITLLLPAEKRLHKEVHGHRCAIHARGLCKHVRNDVTCDRCLKLESNDICQKTLRGTGMDWHPFPCIGCMTIWRNQYGGDLLVDAMVTQEQAHRHTEVVPDAKLDEREANEQDKSG